MDETITNLIKAGAVGHLCMYHDRNAGVDGDWKGTLSYAMRTFPDLPFEVIERLVEVCKTACANAATFMRPDGRKPCGV